MSFNYSKIPNGFYDKILDGPNGIRKFWHWHKFDSVARCIDPKELPFTLLDVGCFSGSFAGRFLNEKTFDSTSIDILESQVLYAKEKYQTDRRTFLHYNRFCDGGRVLGGKLYDAVTLIEVIEHIDEHEIREFFRMLDQVTRPGSQIIITTPNYFSLWPLMEIVLNLVSDVKYEEQHITKFTFFNLVKKLQKIYPEFRDKFQVEFVTTSHSISPFLSIFNYSWAQRLTRSVSPNRWQLPLGSILILKLRKN